MNKLFIIALGGGIGSALRYLVQLGISKIAVTTFPAGTFIVNITGCFIIGLIFGLADRYAALTQEWRLFLITGLCGGYTTFSSFSYEGISLFKQGNYTYFFLYIILSVVLGLLATLGGILIVK